MQQTIDTFSRSAPPRWLLQGLHDQQTTGSGRGGATVGSTMYHGMCIKHVVKSLSGSQRLLTPAVGTSTWDQGTDLPYLCVAGACDGRVVGGGVYPVVPDC